MKNYISTAIAAVMAMTAMVSDADAGNKRKPDNQANIHNNAKGGHGGRGGQGGQGGEGGQGGTGQGGDGGDANVNNQNNNSDSFVYNDNGETKYGDIINASNLGTLALNDACQDGVSFVLAGGMPFVASGSAGFQLLNPAGVAVTKGVSLHEYIDLSQTERNKILRTLDNDDQERLFCLAAKFGEFAVARDHEKVILEMVHDHEKEMLRITNAGNFMQATAGHICPTFQKYGHDEHAVVNSMPKSDPEAHQRECHDMINRAADKAFGPAPN